MNRILKRLVFIFILSMDLLLIRSEPSYASANVDLTEPLRFLQKPGCLQPAGQDFLCSYIHLE